MQQLRMEVVSKQNQLHSEFKPILGFFTIFSSLQ